ncbi:MAG: M60 family metallopeptidase [Muribaculaceae bacterium]|nr:M60 family metallopeptidase [Muribaculaceae bacterium]
MQLKAIITTLFVAIAAGAAFAVNVESGKVYRFVNAGTPGQSMATNASGTNAVTLATDATSQKQQWLVTANAAGTGYYLRNVATGGLLASSRAKSQIWTLSVTKTPDDEKMLMTFIDNGDNIFIRPLTHNNAYAYAHKDASNNVVCWTTSGSPNSSWTLVPVDLTDAELEAINKRFNDKIDEIASASTYQEHLDALFADKACSTLKATGDLTKNADYQALPETLRAMVDKVASGNWAENPGGVDWDSPHALKYRVQMYEPYSEGSNAAALASIQAYTNMNNPTGIVGDKDDLIYVMVNDPVPAGATLYIGEVPDDQMYNSVTAGIPLHQGLNIILCNNDNSHYFIYYSVTTAGKVNGKQVHNDYKITSFSPIKIHIEGGRLNGFFNHIGDSLYAPDVREDFVYTATRATHPMYDFVGRYVILHLHLNDTPSQPGLANQKCVRSAMIDNPTAGADRTQDPVAIMKAWDNMCFAERILMGIQSDEDIARDYNLGYYETIIGDGHSVTDGINTYLTDPGFHFNDYFNNRMMGISQQGTLYMNATSWRTAYNVSTIDAILTLFPSGNIWGPAHEYGHMNQGPMNMAGTTEVSNNIFSNVAMYYAGTYTSRCEYISAQNRNFMDGKTYLEAGTWGTTRMFWQLWCYYHVTGHNKKFYPRLMQLLRQHPLTKTVKTAGNHNERYDMLHFAKMCCIAAEEDLTDFFTAWGFFVPLQDYEIDDYSLYNACLTQEDIDAVKAEIKAFNFPKNEVILLIDDRPGATRTSYPDYPIAKAGELGGLKDFQAGAGAVPSGDFSYTVNGTTGTVATTGNPGVGYLLYDKDGNLIAFANSSTFEVTPEIAEGLTDGTVTVKAMGENGTAATVVNPILDGTPAVKRGLLSDIIARCNALFALIDETRTRVGYLLPNACEDLQNLCKKAVAMVDGNSEDGPALTKMIMRLTADYNTLAADPEARVQIEPGATYRITNNGNPTRALTVSLATSTAAPTAASTEISAEADPYAAQWILEPMDGNNVYALRNVTTGRYISFVPSYRANTVLPTSDTPFGYTIGAIDGQTGVYYLAPEGKTGSAIHMNPSGLIYHYTTTSANTRWTITKVKDAELMDLREQLNALADEAADLLATAGKKGIQEPANVDLNAGCFYANAIQTTGLNAFKSWDHLIDNNRDTYFCSDRSGADSKDGLDHYIRVTPPAGNDLRYIKVSFQNFSVQSPAELIQAYRIDATTDGSNWAPVYACNEGIDNVCSAWNGTDLITVPEGTKAIRFVVTKSGETKAFHYTFLMAEFRLANTPKAVYQPGAKYWSVKAADMENVDRLIDAARFAYLNPSMTNDDLQQHIDNLNKAYLHLSNEMRVSTGVEAIDSDTDNATDDYYDLDGRHIDNPDHGIHIHRHGSTVTKELNR